MVPIVLVAAALAVLALGSVGLARVTRERTAAGRGPDPTGVPQWPEVAFAALLAGFAAAVVVAGLLPPAQPALAVGGALAAVGAVAIGAKLARRWWSART